MSKKKNETDKEAGGETPLMKQYNAIKSKYPDAILLFRIGDFYETFGEDAIRVSKILGIVLTRRHNGAASETELAGFPHHSLENYLPRLVRAGHRVAVCDQLEDPKLTKTIVKRGVTELVTPGVTLNDKVLDHKVNNFLSCWWIHGEGHYAAFADVSTGEFLVASGSFDEVSKVFFGLKPSEVLVLKAQKQKVAELIGDKWTFFPLDEWVFQEDYLRDLLLRQFSVHSLKGFGMEGDQGLTTVSGVILHYLREARHERLPHLQNISRIDHGKYVWLDQFTIRNLEIVASLHENGQSLKDVLDLTVTPMGGRLLHRWLLLPLKSVQAIEERFRVIEAFSNDEQCAWKISDFLKEVGDLERLTSRLGTLRTSPREIAQLKRACQLCSSVVEFLQNSSSAELQHWAKKVQPLNSLEAIITEMLDEDPPALIGKGSVIARGANAELDDLRDISTTGKDYLAGIQQREGERTGISSLKIGFNNVFGYYLEVTNAHKDKVPQDWIRKQTLTGAERYITPELKEYEEKILGAQEKIVKLEQELFRQLLDNCQPFLTDLKMNASTLASLDCLLSFSAAAVRYSYVKPVFHDGRALEIRNSRHPVIERVLPPDQPYIDNDIMINPAENQITMITGPNMSGKSALLRQTALTCLMAQAGSFVPASSARLPVIDKIFTRVGASDNISSGESTFMVEMNETASILNNIGDRSLILLDEIGRGTSTYDGISIAWAIAEYLQAHPGGPITLFATHYHELNEMEAMLTGIKNFHVSVKETPSKVIFLRKLVPGGSEHSFGIHVAKMAGLPSLVTERALEIMKSLEKRHHENLAAKGQKNPAEKEVQLSIFQLDDPSLSAIRDALQKTDIDHLTPVEALMKLSEIKKLAGG
jgi:DNA mismatch repair protein MutS